MNTPLQKVLKKLDDATEFDEAVAEYLTKRVNVLKHIVKYNKRTVVPILVVFGLLCIQLGRWIG